MIRKHADELVTKLAVIHDGIGCMIGTYIDEYSDYGWDNVCAELANVNAQIDMIMTELKYSVVKEEGVYR